MTERDDRIEVVDISEFWVFKDLADTFLLGVRLAPREERPPWSLFWSTFRLLGENWLDFISVGVPMREPGRGEVMKPYRST